MSQNNIPRKLLSGLRASNNVVAALKPAASTTPVNNSFAGAQLPVPRAIENTSRVAAIAPPKAARSTTRLLIPRIIASRAATAAPPDVPNM